MSPMGIVSDDEFDEALEDCSFEENEVNKIESNEKPKFEEIKGPGRAEGDTNVPDSIRKLIGQTSITEGRGEALEIAKQFGISSSSTSAYAHGSTSTATYGEAPNKTVITDAKLRIAKKARGKLLKALNLITDEKMELTKAKDLSGIAKDMSAIVKNMDSSMNPDGDESKKGPTFIFYCPKMKEEKVFDVVQVNE